MVINSQNKVKILEDVITNLFGASKIEYEEIEEDGGEILVELYTFALDNLDINNLNKLTYSGFDIYIHEVASERRSSGEGSGSKKEQDINTVKIVLVRASESEEVESKPIPVEVKEGTEHDETEGKLGVSK